MSKVYDIVLTEIMSDLKGDAGSGNPFVKTVINSYAKELLAEFELLIKSGDKSFDPRKDYLQKFKDVMNTKVIKALDRSSEFKDDLYKKSYERLKALGDESKSYGDLFTEIYQDETYLNEIFVRLVEETEGVAITSAKQLQELTGITEIYGYWDKEKGETVPYGDKKPTKKEAQEIAFNQIEHTFTSAMSFRYYKTLGDILEGGGKYSDLLEVKPHYFNLPEAWRGSPMSDQYSSILFVICEIFVLDNYFFNKPDLKTIAKDIEAPYSVLIDAYKIYH